LTGDLEIERVKGWDRRGEMFIMQRCREFDSHVPKISRVTEMERTVIK
jgi:hypothetical protein